MALGRHNNTQKHVIIFKHKSINLTFQVNLQLKKCPISFDWIITFIFFAINCQSIKFSVKLFGNLTFSINRFQVFGYCK
jgi:hypothetical protein